jgi:propanol-preferring alcohol dehydrogenase
VPLDDVNDIFAGLKAGTIEGRMVLDIAGQASAAAEQSAA